MSHMTQWLLSTEFEENLTKIGCHCPREDGDKVFFCISRDHKINVLRDSLGEIPSPKIGKVVNVRVKGCIVRATELINKDIYVSQIWEKPVSQTGAALFYYKLGQTMLQIVAASLLQIGADLVTNWRSYYKIEHPLLQNKAAITYLNKMYYKLGAGITN